MAETDGSQALNYRYGSNLCRSSYFRDSVFCQKWIQQEEIAGKFDGYSEAWSKSTFEVKSIKELMRLTEEYEENNERV